MIICNDIMAYMFGFFFGRTPLIKLSPKKTWEGFIGGAFATVVFGLCVSAKRFLRSRMKLFVSRYLLASLSISDKQIMQYSQLLVEMNSIPCKNFMFAYCSFPMCCCSLIILFVQYLTTRYKSSYPWNVSGLQSLD